MAMMMYANLFSSAFTALGLLVTLEIVEVLEYFERNPSILPHMFIMAVGSHGSHSAQPAHTVPHLPSGIQYPGPH